jgi:hypothetical protein
MGNDDRCTVRHPGGGQCEVTGQHTEHAIAYPGGVSKWTDDTFARASDRKTAKKKKGGAK